MFLAPWQSPCPGCHSGWITRRLVSISSLHLFKLLLVSIRLWVQDKKSYEDWLQNKETNPRGSLNLVSCVKLPGKCLSLSPRVVLLTVQGRMVPSSSSSSPHPLQICHKLPAPSRNTNFLPGSVTLKLIFAAIENSITLKLAQHIVYWICELYV